MNELACPECKQALRLRSISAAFACPHCGRALLSEPSNWGFLGNLAGLAYVAAFAVTALAAGELLRLGTIDARFAGALAALVVLIAGLRLVRPTVRIYLAPVAWKGVKPLDTSGMPTPAATIWPARGTIKLDQAQLGRWRAGAAAFSRRAFIGSVVSDLGMLGLLASLFAFMLGAAYGVLVLAAAVASIFGGARYTRRLAQQYLRCPQCGEYPHPGTYPGLTARELRGGICFHCGTELPVE